MKKRLFLAVGAATLLAGCGTLNTAKLPEISDPAHILLAKNAEAAQQLWLSIETRYANETAPRDRARNALSSKVWKVARPGMDVLVGAVVPNETQQPNSRFGMLVAEQVSAALAQQGARVTQPRLGPITSRFPAQGHPSMSDELWRSLMASKAKVYVTGTYGGTAAHVMVTLKAVETESGSIIGGWSYTVPRSAMEVYGW